MIGKFRWLKNLKRKISEISLGHPIRNIKYLYLKYKKNILIILEIEDWTDMTKG